MAGKGFAYILLCVEAPDISLEAVFWLLEELPAITEFGDLHR
jgi:hypothetical protein